MDKLNAAVIGLGNIGFKFDLDALRRKTWSHCRAYSKCALTRLAGVVEINPAKARVFGKHYPGIPVFRDIQGLMTSREVDIVSIATPTPTHYPLLRELLKFNPKAVFCEKPMAQTTREAKEMVNLCRKRGVLLAVNHSRRWDGNYIFARRAILNGAIGDIIAANLFYSAQVLNIGTHLFDAMMMLTGEKACCVSGVSGDLNKYDPSVSGWILTKNGIFCAVAATGRREQLVFEIDVFGTRGRLKISENGRKVEIFVFKKSPNYGGYEELSPMIKRSSPANNDRFVDAVQEIALTLKRRETRVSCSGEDGLAALSVSLGLCDSAKRKGKPINLAA